MLAYTSVGGIDINTTFVRMNRIQIFRFRTVLVIASVCLFACTNQKDMTEVHEDIKDVSMDAEMTEQGFRKGVVTEFEGQEAPCDFRIVLSETQSIESLGFPEAFKKSGMKVWVKFIMQRRPVTCDSAMPVEIVEIQERDS